MTARHARTIMRETPDELGYWREAVPAERGVSMFAGLRQKLAAVALLFQVFAAFPQIAKAGYRRGRLASGSRASKPSGVPPGVVVGERDRRAGT
jgi:hypothetical protein